MSGVIWWTGFATAGFSALAFVGLYTLDPFLTGAAAFFAGAFLIGSIWAIDTTSATKTGEKE